ncbi:MAG: GspMb/PilO family protein [Pseudomonadota bacterium]
MSAPVAQISPKNPYADPMVLRHPGADEEPAADSWPRRGSRTSRILAVVVACMPGILVLLGFSAWAIYDYSHTSRLIAEERQRIRELEARTGQAFLYRPLGDAWSDFASTDTSGLLQSDDIESAGEALRSRIEELLRIHGGIVSGIVTEAGDPQDGLYRLTATVEADITENTLPTLLRALEAEPPFVFVESLDARDIGTTERQKRVALRMTVFAYHLAEGTE